MKRSLVLVLTVYFSAGILAGLWYGPIACAVESPPAAITSFESAFESAAQTIKPSVVSISSVRHIAASPPALRRIVPRMPFDGFFGDDFFDHFFFDRGQGRGWAERGLGSGVVVDGRGYILTNNHVVANADELTVHFSDKRTYKAKVVGTDPKTDVAVIKIEGGTVQPAKLGDSDQLRVGQWVIAVGSPFGLEQTITAGIVSAKGRANVGVADYEDFIQTDAAINQGNSGGPLVNLKGEVVGINTAILSRSGGNNGIGLAIPINMAREVMDRLIADGKIVRGWLGLTIQELDEGLASSFGYQKTSGVLIGDVMNDGPAAKAGLKSGDIVISLEGKPVTNVSAFRNRVAQIKPGTKVSLEVWRDRATRKLEVEVGEMPAQYAGAGGAASVNALGLELGDLTPELREKANLDGAAKGALIMSVASGSVAEAAGLRAGDLIVEVQGRKVASAEDANRELSRIDVKKGVRLYVQRGSEGARFVYLRLS